MFQYFFLFIAKYIILYDIYCILFVYSSVEHSGFFPIGHYKQCCHEHLCLSFAWPYLFISVGCIPRNETDGSYDKSMFNILKHCQFIFKLGAAFYIPIINVRGLQFLITLAKTYFPSFSF